MAKQYVKFEPSNEVVSKTYEAVRLAKQTGRVRKGANEVTKSVERGLASLVVIAADVEPEEIVMHLPAMCEGKRIPYTYATSKIDLGKAMGMNVNCAAVAIENQGNATQLINEIVAKVTGESKAENGGLAEQQHKQK